MWTVLQRERDMTREVWMDSKGLFDASHPYPTQSCTYSIQIRCKIEVHSV
jgi:hypothetical protein